MGKRILHYALIAVKYIILIAIVIITLFPMVYSFLGALKENMELLSGDSFFPKELIFDNYVYAWNKVNFARDTFNSIIVSAITVVSALFIASMAGYALGRKQFPGRNLIHNVYLSSMFVAVGSAALYPIYQLCIDLHLNGSLAGIAIVGVGAQVYNIILVIGFLKGIPKEYDESSKIDGCSFFKTYFYIILPLMRPVLGVIALGCFVGSWNNYLMPMILTTGNPALKTLAVGIVEMKSNGEMATLWSVILAGANISIVPIVIVYLFTNKQFVSGLTLGGIKG